MQTYLGETREYLDNLLDLVVQDQNDGTTHTAEHVGEGALEERTNTLVLGDLGHGVEGSGVELRLGAGAHHQPTADGVEGVGDDTGGVGHELRDGTTTSQPVSTSACPKKLLRKKTGNGIRTNTCSKTPKGLSIQGT